MKNEKPQQVSRNPQQTSGQGASPKADLPDFDVAERN